MQLSQEYIKKFKDIFKKKYNKELSDEEARESGENLANLANILYDIYVREKEIERMLKKSPKGFYLSELNEGVYTCMICGNSIQGKEGWRDKYGNKCLICQKAVDDGAIEGWILEDNDNWYKLWEVEDKLKLHNATVRKLARDGRLKSRVINGENNKPYQYIFVTEENYHLLTPKKFEERNMLLMSSGSFFTEKAPNLYKADFKNLKIAYITTATKKVPDRSYTERRVARMKELEWNFESIDIAEHTENELYTKLNEKDIIYVEGGNSFYLLDQIRKKKFDKLIKSKLNQGVLYAGSSAGAYVACPTIEMATWTHPDKFDHCGITNFRGINLIPFVIRAHTTPEIIDKIQDKVQACKFSVQMLTDEQAILINNGKVTLVE